MVELIEAEDLDKKYSDLHRANPDWVLLDETYLKSIENSDKISNTTFLVHGALVDKRKRSYKTTTLICWLMATSRPKYNNFKIVARSWDRLDIRIRRWAPIEA